MVRVLPAQLQEVAKLLGTTAIDLALQWANGPDCLQALSQRQYAVVLLDYSLPGMNGLDVLRTLKRQGHRVQAPP